MDILIANDIDVIVDRPVTMVVAVRGVSQARKDMGQVGLSVEKKGGEGEKGGGGGPTSRNGVVGDRSTFFLGREG